jgi:hypothetical protein
MLHGVGRLGLGATSKKEQRNAPQTGTDQSPKTVFELLVTRWCECEWCCDGAYSIERPACVAAERS